MTTMRLSVLFGLTILLCSCGSKEPIVSHGQPISHWIEEAKSPDAKARKKAVTALGHVGARDPLVVPVLIDAVKDADVGVRTTAILALLNIGPAAKDAIPALRAASSDPDETVRSYAAQAIEKIENPAPTGSP